MSQVSPSAREILGIIRGSGPVTRAELAARTGWGRSAVAQHLELLTTTGLVHEAGELSSTGGRPAAVFAFNPRAGIVLAADLGATHSQIAITDLSANVLAETRADIPIAEGPERVLTWMHEQFEQLVSEGGHDARELRGVGVGVPGPVEFATGRPMNPPIMPGWDGFEVGAWLRDRYGVPAVLDNDVNVMAVGEHRSTWPGESDLLFIKVGTGIGCGVILDGRIHRGAQGAAGDIGHIRVAGHDDVVCRCGNRGCLEAVAGGDAMARGLSEMGIKAANGRAVVALARNGVPEASQLVRQSGRLLGEALASAVNLFNPGVIVIGGDIATADEQLFAGVRETVYRRSLPLATRHLRIVRSALDDRAGVVGAAVTIIEQLFTAAA